MFFTRLVIRSLHVLLNGPFQVRYVHPSDEELKQVALIPKPEKKKKHKVTQTNKQTYEQTKQFVFNKYQ